MPLSPRHEHDHMPIPNRHGGETVFAACINCHDLKDRAEMNLEAAIWWHTLWPKATPLERIGIARFIANYLDALHKCADQESE